MVEVSVDQGAAKAPTTTLWFVLPAVAVMAIPLLARRRFPFGGPATYWLYGAALSFVDGRLVTFMTSVFVLGMAAAFLLGNVRDALKARIGLAVVVGSAAIIVYNAPNSAPSEQILIPLLFGICWLAGFALHGRAEQADAAELRANQAERDREAAARVAVAEERARIARELHDVVAHSVSVMVLQAGAVRHKLPAELEADKDALKHVEQTGRAALAEMRRLLGAMRSDGDGLDRAPQPGVDALGSLLEEVGRAGLPVRLHVSGDQTPLPRGIDLSAFRIVQEGLTNALKHARASHADVTLGYGPEELRIEVRDDGVGSSTGAGRGHGLVGVRERVKIYGGEMTAGVDPDGGFVLRTRLPLGRNGS
ncbi:MAG: sensor histidine kinase [Candidatus Rokuibacteriota bacterium]|nr:MAG: sensor histidine kinase [Candidatus Rokubacteria bacterium]